MPAYRMTLIPHPVQLLTTAELHALADAALPEILSRLMRVPGEDTDKLSAVGPTPLE